MSLSISVLSIDVGVSHLGLSVSLLSHEYKLEEIIWVDMIDITSYTHRKVCREKCTLHHTKTFSDWMEHLYQENRIFFEAVDVILVERQPPMGFVVVEQLIFNKYRDKTVLISPRKVHCHFNISDADYDKRKEYSINIARPYLTETLQEQTTYYERSHDIADSICMLLYWRDKKEKEYLREQRMERLKTITREEWKGKNVFEKLETFRY